MNTSAANLLEYLADKIRCSYLSDLHNSQYQKDLYKILSDVDSTSYSLAHWNEAVFYITSEKKDFLDRQEALQFLLDYLNQ